jgi:Ni/Fe-hydrogenase 1 B-type cytochrome subunit
VQKKIYVWEAPVRLTHWVNVVCLLILSFTGIYINNPFITAASTSQYIMGWIRFIHFVTAYVFVVNWAVRLYWSFSGNLYSSWMAFFPFTKENVDKLFRQMSFYALITKKPPSEIGHSPLAGIIYFLILVLCIISMLTGFALYSLNSGGIMHAVFGWVFLLFSIPVVRLIHHMIMWLLLYFAILHVYIVFFLNSVERNGLISSIFDGYKFIETENTK